MSSRSAQIRRSTTISEMSLPGVRSSAPWRQLRASGAQDFIVIVLVIVLVIVIVIVIVLVLVLVIVVVRVLVLVLVTVLLVITSSTPHRRERRR